MGVWSGRAGPTPPLARHPSEEGMEKALLLGGVLPVVSIVPSGPAGGIRIRFTASRGADGGWRGRCAPAPWAGLFFFYQVIFLSFSYHLLGTNARPVW